MCLEMKLNENIIVKNEIEGGIEPMSSCITATKNIIAPQLSL